MRISDWSSDVCSSDLEVTGAARDQALVQDGLSERLANKGILPMFGFPTRARLLYHKQPQNWPPRQTVDRDLALAVSMFAPGAEPVKERRSAERRVGTVGVSTCRSRWWTYN